jgi:hypothetical protein
MFHNPKSFLRGSIHLNNEASKHVCLALSLASKKHSRVSPIWRLSNRLEFMKNKNVFPSFWLVRSNVHECSFPVTTWRWEVVSGFGAAFESALNVFSSFLFVEAQLAIHHLRVSSPGLTSRRSLVVDTPSVKLACPVFIVLLRKSLLIQPKLESPTNDILVCHTTQQPSTKSFAKGRSSTVSWAGEDDRRTWKETVILSDLVSCADLFLRTH